MIQDMKTYSNMILRSLLLFAAIALTLACAQKEEGSEPEAPEVTGFSTDVDTLWFSRPGIEKLMTFEHGNISSCQVVETPDGWQARFEGADLYVTCPSDFRLSAMDGDMTVTAEFTTGEEPVTLTFAVGYQQPLTLITDYMNRVTVKMATHALADTEGYIVGAVRKNAYSEAEVLEWLNSDGASQIRTETAVYDLSESVNGYEHGAAYVVYAVAAYPSDAVAAGLAEYVAADLMLVSLGSDNVRWSISDVRFDYALLTASVTGLSGWFGGFSKLADWNNYGRKNIVEHAEYGQLEKYTASSYEGGVSAFPSGADGGDMLPDTEYVVWLLPESPSGEYTEQDVVQMVFRTSTVVADASVPTPSFEVTDVAFGGFSAVVTPAQGAYKTYAAIRRVSAVPTDTHESLMQMFAIGNYSEGQEELPVSDNSFGRGEQVCLLAVTLTQDGRYGNIVQHTVSLRELAYTDALSMEVTELKQGEGTITMSVSFAGEPSEIIYMVSDNVYFTDAVIEEKLAMEQMGEAVSAEISKLGGKIEVSGLSNGSQYVLYAVLKDAEGTPSNMYKYEFEHRMDLTYSMKEDEDYMYAMPQIEGTKRLRNYVFSVTKPAGCVKFWLLMADPEYVTGSEKNNTNKMVAMDFELLGESVHTESISSMTFENVRVDSRIYLVWLDDRGKYHIIYEFNPNN